MPDLPEPILITGANGHLGRRLIERLGAATGPAVRVRALVRSSRAADQVRGVETAHPPEIRIADYTDEAAVAEATVGCAAVVHLVGIIKEGRDATYESAHERTCEIVARAAAAAGARRIVYLSIFGSSADSANPCLASKGRAEDILLGGDVPATVIRVPMVLGRDDPASTALRRQARARVLVLVGGGATMQQPSDAADVVEAVVGALGIQDDGRDALDLGGPERLTHRALVMRAAALHGHKPMVIPVPLALARGVAATFERLLPNPPVTVAMLDILQHDDRIDEAKSCERLGIRLTPLDETLRRYVGPESADDE